MSTIIKAAAVQISPMLYSRQATVEKVVRKIGELGERGVRFAIFPEMVVPYYTYFSFVQPPFQMAKEHQRLLEESVIVPSAETHAIGEAAKRAKMVVSIGVNERDGGTQAEVWRTGSASNDVDSPMPARFDLDDQRGL